MYLVHNYMYDLSKYVYMMMFSSWSIENEFWQWWGASPENATQHEPVRYTKDDISKDCFLSGN